MCVYMNALVCVSTWMCLCVCVYMDVLVCGGQRSTLGIVPQELSTIIF